MKKKKLKKKLAELRRFIPVFKNGLLGVDFEIEMNDVQIGRIPTCKVKYPAPFLLTFTFEGRTEQYTGTVNDLNTEVN